MYHQVRTIDLDALRRNVRAIRAALPSPTRLMAVVKADAYGHGMAQCARAALEAGADQLAVALVQEGVALRQAGIEAPVLVLGAADEREMQEACANRLTVTLCSAEMAQSLQRAAQKCGCRAAAHLKIDTGMGRIGVRSETQLQAVLDVVHRSGCIDLTGVFTHFADADGDDMTYTLRQLEAFRRMTKSLPPQVLRHCANSAAIHRLPEATMDMVRAGVSMYGYPPVETDIPLTPVMTWTSKVTFVKTIDAGDAVSYGCTFRADNPMRVATVACGYGDGYHRAAGGKAEVLIRGKRARVIGRICMDQMMADVTDIPDAAPGDRVVLIGRDGAESITAEDLAAWAGTISYEVLLAATGRVHREWIHEND